jgi:hypothetical protein
MRHNSRWNLTNGNSFHAIQYLEQSLRQHQVRRTAYFYFDYSVKQQSAVDVLASLLKQLASPLNKVPLCLNGLYQKFKPLAEEVPRPTKETLLELLLEFGKEYPQVFVFLDAFDECDAPLRVELVSIIQVLHDAKIKVWVTTQPGQLQGLEKGGLTDAVKAEIKAKETDVARYVRSNLTNVAIDDQLRTDIINTISSGVDGMCDSYIYN